MSDAQSKLAEQIQIESTGEKPSEIERAMRALREIEEHLALLTSRQHCIIVDLQRAMEAGAKRC